MGEVIGVKVGTVLGDVYAEQVLQPQLFLLSEEGRSRSWRRFLNQTTMPYKYLYPYTARDQALFFGRENDIRDALSRIAAQPLLTVYGRPGVGKTSLLAAGVIPDLMVNGALVVRIEDYGPPPAELVRTALAANQDQINISLPEEAGLPALARSVVEQVEGTLVLVFDHVERVFHRDFDDDSRNELASELSGTLAALDLEHLRMVVVVDSRDRLEPLAEQVPGLGQNRLRLEPLTCEEAVSAIRQPLVELRQRRAAAYVSYYRDIVETQLVPDLDWLSKDDKDSVHPLHLQIVCYRLYESASANLPESGIIDVELYRSLNSAEGIFYSYVDEELGCFDGQKSLAKQVLEAMLPAPLEPGVTVEQLVLNGATVRQKRKLMDRLVEAKLLHVVSVNGQPGYAFSSPVVRESVLRQASPEARRLVDSADDLERAWSAWVAHGRLARRSQLHYLAQAGDSLSPWPAQVLLLLRSALARHETIAPWLRLLRNDDSRALISQLDNPESQNEREGGRSLDQARKLLGLAGEEPPLGWRWKLIRKSREMAGGRLEDRYTLPPRPEEATGFGDVAWSAVRHRSAQTRQTAALALAATEDDTPKVVIPLGRALSALSWPWRRWQRRAELFGVLTDADVEITAMPGGMMARGSVWLWRFWRRVRADWVHIAAWSIGGALGAGLGLGLLRMVIAILAGDALWGVHFQIYSYQGLLLGLMLCLGMALSDALLLRPVGVRDAPTQRADSGDELGETESESVSADVDPLASGTAEPQRQQDITAVEELEVGAPGAGRFGWSRPVLAVALGTLFFGGAHLLQALVTNVFLVAPALLFSLGLLFGLGLSLSLYDQPFAFWHLRTSRWLLRMGGWLLRLGVVAGTAVLTQILFDLASGIGVGVTIAWTSTTYSSYGWPHVWGLVDAALVGIVLTAGITLGLVVAERQFQKWRDRVIRAGD
jgi:hypothetical protein